MLKYTNLSNLGLIKLINTDTLPLRVRKMFRHFTLYGMFQRNCFDCHRGLLDTWASR